MHSFGLPGILAFVIQWLAIAFAAWGASSLPTTTPPTVTGFPATATVAALPTSTSIPSPTATRTVTPTANATPTASPRGTGPVEPAKPPSASAAALKNGRFAGVLWGAYVNPDETWRGTEDDKRKVQEFEALIGRKIAIDMRYVHWHEDWAAWPLPIDTWDADSGRIPVVTWGSGAPPSTRTIASGKEDGWIRERARASRSLGAFFLRPLWEMNGDWSPWNAAGDLERTKDYIAAWRRVHRLFQEEGATNAIFVWSPNAEDIPQEPWNHWMNYYPGDAYVDWVGMDGYNWGTTQPWHRWRSLATVFGPLYRDFAGQKPIMVAETASTEVGGDKAEWIRDALASIKDMPHIKAVVWFHANKETDWRVNSSQASLQEFRALAHDPYFGAMRE